MPIVLRNYTPLDRPWLVDLHGTLYAQAEGFDDTFGALVESILRDFEAAHDPASERGFVAEEDGTPLGSIFCVRQGPETAKLRLFILTPEARGKGLGQMLHDACTGFAHAAGYKEMALWTHESHKAACALYRRNGWRLVRSEPVHSFGVDLVEQGWEITL